MQKAVVCSFKFIANNISALSYKSVEAKIIQSGYATKYSGNVYQIGIEFSETRRNIVAFAWQQA